MPYFSWTSPNRLSSSGETFEDASKPFHPTYEPSKPCEPHRFPPQMQRCLEGMTVGYMSKIVQNHRSFRPLKKTGSIFTAQTTKSWVICEWTTETHLPFMGNFKCLACVLQRIYRLQAMAKNQSLRLSSFHDGPWVFS